MEARDRWRLLAATLLLLAGVGVAIGGVGFAIGAGRLAAVTGNVQAWTQPATSVRANPVALWQALREEATLETASLELERIVSAQRGSEASWSWVGEQLELVARGTVAAGVDLGALATEDVVVDAQGVVHVRLPPASVLHVRLDDARTFVLRRERGWFGSVDPHLEQEARREAVRLLHEAAEQQGLVERADQTAEAVVRSLLLGAGAPEVRFID